MTENCNYIHGARDTKGLVINYGEGGGYKMGKSRVQNFLRPPLKTG